MHSGTVPTPCQEVVGVVAEVVEVAALAGPTVSSVSCTAVAVVVSELLEL